MKRVLLLCALYLICAGAAQAVTTDPRIDATASRISGRSVTVGCYDRDEADAPYGLGAWGYVYLGTPYEYLDIEVCQGLLGILDHDATVPEWREALGALVLAHESYHLNIHKKNVDNEAVTECRAIRATAGTIRLLGGGEQLVATLMPFALAIHWRIAARYQDYYYPACRVPWWWT
jgi:hypothetical protein